MEVGRRGYGKRMQVSCSQPFIYCFQYHACYEVKSFLPISICTILPRNINQKFPKKIIEFLQIKEKKNQFHSVINQLVNFIKKSLCYF